VTRICCGEASPNSAPRFFDAPVFYVNLDAARADAKRTNSEVCPVLAEGACLHRVSAMTPSDVDASPFGRDTETHIHRGLGPIPTAVAVSHIMAWRAARRIYPGADLVVIMEDDMTTSPLLLRSRAAAQWAGARAQTISSYAQQQLPSSWSYLLLFSIMRTVDLKRLKAAWEVEGRPAALPVDYAESLQRGCCSRCCAVHNALAAGAYALSSAGLQLLLQYWGEDQPPRACWRLPELGCDAPRANVSKAFAASHPPNAAFGAQATVPTALRASMLDTLQGRAGRADPDLAYPTRLKSFITADICLSRIDKYGPPLSREEAEEAMRAQRRRNTSSLRRQWHPFVATPSMILGDESNYLPSQQRSSEVEAGPKRLGLRVGGWLKLHLLDTNEKVRDWWQNTTTSPRRTRGWNSRALPHALQYPELWGRQPNQRKTERRPCAWTATTLNHRGPKSSHGRR